MKSRSGLDPLGSPANWHCVALEKLSRVKWKVLGAHHLILIIRGRIPAWPTPIRRGGSSRPRSTKRTLKKLSEQLPGKDYSLCGNRIWIMPFRANAVIRAGGSPAPARA
jgi:hypothetical protein